MTIGEMVEKKKKERRLLYKNSQTRALCSV